MLVRAINLFVAVLASSLLSADEPPNTITPDRFGIVFIMGYAGDSFPQDEAEFEKLIE